VSCAQLGLDKVHAVIGCSMGGMTGIALASLFPDTVSRLAVTACTAKTTPVRQMARTNHCNTAGYEWI
jgi:homoserine acetyltransferase